MKLIAPDKSVKYCDDPRLNHSREILPKAVGSGNFDSFFRDDFRPEVASNVISDVTVGVGRYVCPYKIW